MKKKEWNEGLNQIDPDLVEKHIEQKERLRQKNKKNKAVWLRLGAIAACFLLIVSAVIVVPILREDDPGVITPPDETSNDIEENSEPGTTDNNRPNVPSWDTAQYSAEDIAKIFDSVKFDSVATNAYTKIYVPDSKYLYIGKVTDDEYLKLYQHTQVDKELNEVELKAFIDAFLPKLAESLNIPVSQYNIKENNYSTGDNTLSADFDIDPFYLSVSQNTQRNSLSFSKLGSNRQIAIDGETIQIDQRLSDEEIIDSIQSIKSKLFGIFGISFSNAKVVRYYGSYSKYGVEHIDIYFYDQSAHELNSSQSRPITDYMYISFDNFPNYSGDIVSDSILTVSSVYYLKNRSDLGDTQYDVVANAKRISISEAEALLYNGYVFGGHSCPLCMLAQDKIDFEGYDFVDIEYVFEYSNENGTPSIGIPFYAFYKSIGTSENGNTIYAKTYVPAIEVSGYKEYFESQKDNHTNNRYVDEVE